MPKVHLPDGRVVHFPDSMTPEQMTSAVEGLSTKPNTGMATADLQAANLKGRTDLPSPSGFLGNVASSGGKFLSDAVSGIPALAKMAGGVLQAGVDPATAATQAGSLMQAAPRMLRLAGQGVKDRYGSVDNALGTAYHDPVGMAADVSTVAGGLGLGAKAGGASKIARVLEGASELSNPLAIPGKLAQGAAHGVANTMVRGTLRAPAAVRNDFGGGKAVADAVLKDRVYSEASAQRKLTGSVAEADKMLADAEGSGVAGVPRRAIAESVLGQPQATAKLRARLGVPDTSPELMDTAKRITRNNPREIPLTDAQAMKREAQTLAYEAGVDNNTVKKAAEKAKAGALRQGIEDRVPAVGPVNERTQRLIGSQQAFSAAEDRPRALTNFLALLGGTGIGVPAAIGVKAMDSPRLGAMAGIGVDSIGKGMNAGSLRKAALLARLLEEVPNQ